MTGEHPVRRAGTVAITATACLAVLVLAPMPSTIDVAADATAGLVLGIIAAFRVAAVVATGYVAVVSLVAVGAALLGWSARVQRLWLGPAAVRRLVFGSSMALVATTAPLATAAADPAPLRRPPTMVMVERPPSTGLHPDAGPSPTTAAPTTTTTTAPPTTTAPTAAAPTTTAPTAAAPTTTAPTAAAPTTTVASPPPAAGADTGRTWTVRPGEHFWSIAAAIVADELGQPATPAQVHARWRSLIANNAAQLVDPGNPDLLLPGQILRL